MRDGIRLAANVFLPPGRLRAPVILERTPYGKGEWLIPNHQAFVDRGYIVVVQDVRGRYASEGKFNPLHQEGPDGNDTLNWIARQPWCDGKIGMVGGSYRGIVQWKAALTGNPYLKAIAPVVSGYDDYRDRFYSTGGAMKLGHRLEWMSQNLKVAGFQPDFAKYVLHLPLRTSDLAATGATSEMFQQIAAHPAYDSFWQAVSVKENLAKIRIPVFAVGGWYDNFVQSDLEAFAALDKQDGLNRIVVGPWPHNLSKPFKEVDYGNESMPPLRTILLDWFDRWLMGKEPSSVASDPPARIFVMGSNRWHYDDEWPPAEAKLQKLFLDSTGGANTLDGNGSLSTKFRSASPADHFVFDPRDPVPTRGGSLCCNPEVFPWGPLDQRSVERRTDVLVYTTRPLSHDIEVIGPVQAVLHVSTTAADTDFTAKLVDVFPDGHARNLTDGILRLRYRNSLGKPELAKPGEIYRIVVDAGVTGNVFKKGHAIRLEVSSSNFPRFDRNPNTGGSVVDETRLWKATQTVYHDREHPSYLAVMVMPAQTSARVAAARPTAPR